MWPWGAFQAYFHTLPHTPSPLTRGDTTDSLPHHFCSCLSLSTARLPLYPHPAPFARFSLDLEWLGSPLDSDLCPALPLQGRSVDSCLITLVLVIPFAVSDAVTFKKTHMWKKQQQSTCGNSEDLWKRPIFLVLIIKGEPLGAKCNVSYYPNSLVQLQTAGLPRLIKVKLCD